MPNKKSYSPGESEAYRKYRQRMARDNKDALPKDKWFNTVYKKNKSTNSLISRILGD